MRRTTLLLTVPAVTAAAATIGLTAGSAFAGAPASTPAAPQTSSPSAPGQPASEVKLPPHPTLQQVQSAAATDIALRVDRLNAAIVKVQGKTDLGADQATILHTLQGDVSGLQQLGATIASDTTVKSAAAGYTQMFTNYRVFVLALPVAGRVSLDDAITNIAAPRLTKVAARIASHETPANQAQVQPLLADLASKVSSATATVSGAPATLEGYTPAAWNANHSLLASSKTATQGAVAAIKQARSDAQQAAAAVGLGRGHAPKSAG